MDFKAVAAGFKVLLTFTFVNRRCFPFHAIRSFYWSFSDSERRSNWATSFAQTQQSCFRP